MTLSDRRHQLARKTPAAVEFDFLRFVDRGDRVALGRTIRAVSPELGRIARYYVGRQGSTEDIVQATILTAIERAESFDPTRRLMPWLTGILLNKIAAERRDARKRSIEIQPEDHPEPTPLQLVEATEIESLVAEAVDQLPARYREVLDLYLRQGKRSAEIALELERPPGTIRAQIHRGLRRLRAILPPSLSLGVLFALRRRTRALCESPRAATSLANATAWAPLALMSLGLASAALLVGWLVFDTSPRAAPATAGRIDFPASVALHSSPDAMPLESEARARRSTLTDERGANSVRTAPPRPLRFRVIDRVTRSPLASAEVHVRVELASGEQIERSGTTDAGGFFGLDLDATQVVGISSTTRLANHVPLNAHWSTAGLARAFSRTHVLDLPLNAGQPIGGRVVDERGYPVADAHVFLSSGRLLNTESWTLAAGTGMDRTDSDGRWQIDAAPVAPSQFKIRVAHPDYVPDLAFDGDSPSVESLRALDATIRLRRGDELDVSVRDASGAPVASAIVSLVEARDPPRFSTPYRTDELGRLRFTRPNTEKFLVRVASPGFVTQTQRVRASRTHPVEVIMPRAEDITITILDHAGVPVPDAQVRRYGATWLEAKQTSRDGTLTVRGNPDGILWVQIRRSSLTGAIHLPVDLKTRTVHLPRAATFLISATDAETDRALDNYTVRVLDAQGRRLGDGYVGGSEPFELSFTHRSRAARIEVSRVGYETSYAELLASGAQILSAPVRLNPVETLEFSITSPDDGPVDFIALAVATAEDPARLSATGLVASERHPNKLLWYDGGAVTINQPQGEFALAIFTRVGFAFVSSAELDDSDSITVSPWGCVEGLTSSDAPVGLRISANAWAPGLELDYSQHPDAAGRFHFCTVPAGRLDLFSESHSADALHIVVRAGATTRADI